MLKKWFKKKRKQTVRTVDAIESIKNLLIEKPHISIKDIASSVGITPSSTYRIISKVLGLKLICSKYVPKILDPMQKQERVFYSKKLLKIFKNSEYNLRKVIAIDETWIESFNASSKRKRSQYLEKVSAKKTLEKGNKFQKKWLYAIAFNSRGETFQKNIGKYEKLNSKWYINKFLSPLIKLWKQKHPRWCNPILIQDNALPHVSKQTKLFLDNLGVQYPKLPPYSPYLSPPRFLAFSKIKGTSLLKKI